MTKQPIPYTTGDDLTPSKFEKWWGVFNAELSVRGLEHAGFGVAHDMFKSGFTPDNAAKIVSKGKALEAEPVPVKKPDYRLPLYRGCKQRMDTLHLRGKKRDDEALSYIAGYCTGLQAMGAPDAHLPTFMMFLMSVRGYAELEKALTALEAEQANPAGCGSVDGGATPTGGEV